MEETTTVLVKPSEHAVVITQAGTEETYSLDVAPSAQLRLVRESKQEILHELNIDTVVQNLHNTAKLLFVAYNALAGTQIQSKMSGLQHDLLGLTQDAVVATQDFQNKSKEVIGYILTLYRYLLDGEEPTAVRQLKHIGDRATAMANTSETLAKRFERIASRTEEVLEAAQNEENLEHKEIEALQKQLRELTAHKEAQEALQKELVKGIGEMQELYNEARARQEEESDRALILGVVSAITSAIGAGVAMFAASQNPAGAAMHVVNGATGSAGSSSTESSIVTTSDIKEKEEELKTAQGKAKEAETEAADKKATAEKEEATAATRLQEAEDAETSAKKKEAAADKPYPTEAEKNAAKQAAKEAREEAGLKKQLAEEQQKKTASTSKAAQEAAAKAEKLTNAATAVAAALKDLNDGIKNMQTQAAAAAASVQAEKMSYLNKKLDLEEKSRKAMTTILESTKLIENNTTNTNIAKTAVETLHIAVGCLKEVVTALAASALFWRSMEQYCKQLANNKLTELVADVQSLALEKRLREYQSADFMCAGVQFLARWVALHSVMTDYLAATVKVRELVTKNIDAAPKIEDALKMAPGMARELQADMQRQLDKSNEKTSALQAELAAVTATPEPVASY